MFIWNKTASRLINLRQVRDIRRRNSGGTCAEMHGGELVELNDDIWEIAGMTEVLGIVPATPGYEVLAFHCMDDEEVDKGWVQREAVLAWKIGERAMPVTLDPYLKSATIKRPDGSVTDPDDSDWDSEQEWLNVMRKRHEAERATKLKSA